MLGQVNGTNTILFITKKDVSQDYQKDITYRQIMSDYREGKAEPNRTQLTLGVDRINYPKDCGMAMANLLMVKLLLNIVVSTLKAQYMMMDIKNIYLDTPLKRYEYLQLKLDDMPDDIKRHYKLRGKATQDGWKYVEVRKGMCGLPQAGLLVQELATNGYTQSKLTPGLWKHHTKPIQFCLIVDDFGVQYMGRENAKYLKQILERCYEISTGWNGTTFSGIIQNVKCISLWQATFRKP